MRETAYRINAIMASVYKRRHERAEDCFGRIINILSNSDLSAHDKEAAIIDEIIDYYDDK